MAATVARSRLLAIAAVPGNSTKTIYTVPLGELVILKFVVLDNGYSNAASYIVVHSSPGGGTALFRETNHPPETVTRTDLWLVLEEANTITLTTTDIAGMNISLSGARFEQPAT